MAEETDFRGVEQQIGNEPITDGHAADIFKDSDKQRRWLSTDLRDTYDIQDSESARVEAELAAIYPPSERRRVVTFGQGDFRNLDQTGNADVRGTPLQHPPTK